MMKAFHLLIVTCAAMPLGCSHKRTQAKPVGTGGDAPAAVDVAPAAFITMTYEVSEAERVEVGTRAAGVQLARMTVSEGTSLQPLNKTWKHDMQGILQVARNNQTKGDSLLETLSKLSPHVSMRKPVSPRHSWIATLPSRGIEAPLLWLECTGWETVKGRQRGVPVGCDGAWEAGADNWDTVRSYAISLVKMSRPPRAVQGKPLTWGGLMDIATFLKEQPYMCWLESGETLNYYFGLSTDPANHCKHMPTELVQESRTLSAMLIKKALKRKVPESQSD